MRTDWAVYNMILFNIIQNAIKYNVANGKITIELDLLQNSYDDSSIVDSSGDINEGCMF